ncbi:MAG: Spy/CpxP family protein refolding chaperone [Stellaceae bacterium]
MSHRTTTVAIAVITVFVASAALAQSTSGTPQPAAASPAPQAMPGMPMGGMAQGTPGGMMQGGMMQGSGGMPMMGMMMSQGGMGGMMAGHVEGRIAFLRTELKITDAQQTLWNALADVMRANTAGMGGMANGMAMMGAAATLPDRLAAREKMMTAHLEQLRKLRAAVEPLYAAFDDAQKKTADELMSGPMGMGMM